MIIGWLFIIIVKFMKIEKVMKIKTKQFVLFITSTDNYNLYKNEVKILKLDKIFKLILKNKEKVEVLDLDYNRIIIRPKHINMILYIFNGNILSLNN